ncbi:MAG: hypothetical protein JWQ57_2184 [Mucilaginibacter sp.]|nr:hypothetical protein [Mucilaginibacter sp.]
MKRFDFELSLDTYTANRSQSLNHQTMMLSKSLLQIVIAIALIITVLVFAYLYYQLIIGMINSYISQIPGPGFRYK